MGEFQCETCDKSYGNKQNLKRHYNTAHGGAIPSGFDELQNTKYECPNCHEMVAHLTKHAKYCKATRGLPASSSSTGSLVARAVALSVEEAAAEHQQQGAVGGAQRVQQVRLTSEILPQDLECIKDFAKYGVGDGNVKESSMGKYVDQVKNYVRFCYREVPGFSLAALVRSFTDEEPEIPPACFPHFTTWIGNYTSVDARGLAINGFLKLVDYVTWKFDKIGATGPILSERWPLLERTRRIAETENKTANKKILQKKAVQDMEDEDETSQEELLEFKERYDNCEQRKRYFDVLRDMENAHKTFSLTRIRDFLAWELYLSSGGMRPDVVRNLTLFEFSQPKKVSVEGAEEVVCVEVAQHKTAHVYGPAQLVMNKRLYSLLQKFAKFVRPKITGRNQSEVRHDDLLFCRESGKKLDRLVADNFMEWAGVNRELRPYDFRHMYASEAVKNLDRDTAAKVARAHGHSEAIRDKHYAKRSMQRSEWAQNRQKIRGEGGDQHLPSASESDSSDDEFRETFRQQRQAEKEAEAKRATANRVHIDTPRRAFSNEEKAIILDAFTGYEKGNLTDEAYAQALVNHRGFSRLVTDHLDLPSRRYKGQNKSEKEIREQVKNCWRAEWRKKH